MTTTVKIEAHCSDDKEVLVSVEGQHEGETHVLQNGETHEVYAYDERVVKVREREK